MPGSAVVLSVLAVALVILTATVHGWVAVVGTTAAALAAVTGFVLAVAVARLVAGGVR